jgi:hypothetical protein
MYVACVQGTLPRCPGQVPQALLLPGGEWSGGGGVDHLSANFNVWETLHFFTPSLLLQGYCCKHVVCATVCRSLLADLQTVCKSGYLFVDHAASFATTPYSCRRAGSI